MIGLAHFLPLGSVNVQTVTQLLKKISLSTWVIGFLVVLIYQALNTTIDDILENLFKSPDGTPNWVWLVAGFSVLLNIAFSVGITFWLLSSVKKQRSWSGDFQSMLIETLRVWGKILLYTLILILPGLWKWISSIFVPFIVLFSQKYQSGEQDAIEWSKKIFMRVWFQSISVLIVFSVVIPLVVTTSFDQYRDFKLHPFGAIVLGFVDYVGLIITLFLLLKFFLQASREVENELIF